MDTSSLVWSMLFGAVGLGFFMYGKRQKVIAPMVCGFTLMIFPYFVSNLILLIIIGLVLIAIPYFLRD